VLLFFSGLSNNTQTNYNTMKLNKFTQLTALSMSLLGASSAAASNDALLDLLVQKGVLSSAEATSVAAELKGDSRVSFSSKGKETVKLRFNGRMHYQYDSLDAENGSAEQASTNHFYFRRLRVGFKAEHKSGLYADTVLNFADSDFSLVTAIAGYKYSDALNVGLGFQKVPFGFQETTSSSKIKTIERSAANRFFADDIDFSSNHTGIHAKGNLAGGFSYAAAVTNAVQGEGSKLGGSANADNDLAAYGRVQWKNDSGLLLGFDAGSQSNSILKTNDDGDPVITEDVVAYTGYVNYKLNGFDLLGEYFSGDLGGQGDVDGYAVRLAYKAGKFEPVFRYSHLKADKFEIDTDELIRRAPSVKVSGDNAEIDSYYFGVNYYASKAVSLMVGYELAEAENDGGDSNDVDGVRARMQILW